MNKNLLPLLAIPVWLAVIPQVSCVDFVDSTDVAGLLGTGIGNGIAFVDYDNDGDQDIYVSADPHDILYRNNGDGTLSDVTEEAGVSLIGDGVAAAFGDYDNDGDPDLYVAVNDGWDNFFQNEGGGLFREVFREVRINNPDRARSATFADFDNDGFLDIYVVNENAANILYRNRNGKNFENVAEAMDVAHNGPGRSSAWGDYDNDGDLDLYVTNKGSLNVLYRNDGTGFKNVVEDAGVEGSGDSTGVAFADYDSDGYLDIYVGSAGPNLLYRNNGDGTFMDLAQEAGVAHPGEGSTPAFGDYDNDGDLDLYLAVWDGKAAMYRNNGDGVFEDVTEEAGMGAIGNAWAAVFNDYDRDGDLDIYTTYTTRPNIMYQNNGNNNNWLHVRALGAFSNRDGIGARIAMSVGGVLQIREVSGGSGYGSQGSLAVEFGLGGNVVADLVEIRWPLGMVTRLTGVHANQWLLMEENFWAVQTYDGEGQESDTKISVPGTQYQVLGASRLLPNYPNPFNPETWLPYQLAEQADVTITIYTTTGRPVRTLELGHKVPGIYASKGEAACWDGRDGDGERLAAGIYFYQLGTGSFLQMRKMILR